MLPANLRAEARRRLRQAVTPADLVGATLDPLPAALALLERGSRWPPPRDRLGRLAAAIAAVVLQLERREQLSRDRAVAVVSQSFVWLTAGGGP